MGIDTALAIEELDTDFICAICHDIVQNPVITTCEHYFCDSCIRPWIQANSTCPIERDSAEEAGLSRPQRYYRNKLAEVRLRCPFSGTETTYEAFERHKMNCPENPDAWMECNFCHVKHMINEEDNHQQSCLPFLRDKIAKNEVEKNELKRKREEDKKEIERLTKKIRTAQYISTWNAKFPTPKNHTQKVANNYYTWNNHVGNLVDGTRKINPRFKLDHGEMEIGLRLRKATDTKGVLVNFYLKTGKKGRVKFTLSMYMEGNVLWQKEVTQELEVISNRTDGWTGERSWDDLPSDLPSNLLVHIGIAEWEPNTE